MRTLFFAAMVAALIAVVGTAMAQDEIATQSLVMELQLVGSDVVGVVPEGMRMDGYVRGAITEGLLTGATVTATDYLLIRRDGVGVIDVRAMAVLPGGVTAAMTFKGFFGEPTPGMFEAMLVPDFEFPDVDMPAHGALWLQTMAPQYAFVNHTVFGCVGSVNSAQGAVRYSCRSLAR